MRVLLLTGSSPHAMILPQLGDRQIVAGPDWPDAQTPDGHWVSLRTPAGEYDIATLLAKIPTEQMPHAIVSLADATWRNMPQNLGSFDGEKTLLILDSEKLVFPLAEMFRYIGAECYGRVVFLQGPERLGQYLADLAAEFMPGDAGHEPVSILPELPHLSRAS